MIRCMKLAVYQDTSTPLDFERNLSLIDGAAGEASATGAELLLTPELFATGYVPLLIAESVSAVDVERLRAELAAIARRHSIGLVASIPGQGAAHTRGITAILFDATGAIVAEHTKVQLFGPDEQAAFVAGDSPPSVVDFDGLRVSLGICYDVEFPEFVRAAAVAGAELLLVPTAIGAGFENVSTVLIPARAMENSMTVAYANHCGVEDGFLFAGTSVIADPSGALVARAGTGREILYATVGAHEVSVDYLRDRRSHLYAAWGAR
jgi:predicted amidohydrolase